MSDNTIENKLRAKWAATLRLPLEKVGLDDDLQSLGADSLSYLVVYSEMDESGFFSDPNKFLLSRNIKAQIVLYEVQVTEAVSDEQAESDFKYIPFSSQSWFLSETMAEKNRFSLNVVYDVKREIDQNVLQQALTRLLKAHSALRVAFPTPENSNLIELQQYERKFEVLVVADYSSLTLSEANSEYAFFTKRLTDAIDIVSGRQFITGYVKMPANADDRLLLVVHHMAADAFSLIILRRELWKVYSQLLNDQHTKELSEGISIFELSNKMVKLTETAQFADDYEFWRYKLGKGYAVMSGSEELEGQSNTLEDSLAVRASMSKIETSKLVKSITPEKGFSLRDLSVLVLHKTIFSWESDRNTLILPVDSARSSITKKLGINVSNTVGWLSWSPPVLLEGSFDTIGSADYRDLWVQLKECDDKGYAYEIGCLMCKKGGHDLKIPNCHKVVFNFLGTRDMFLDEENAAGLEVRKDCEFTQRPFSFKNARALNFYIEVWLEDDQYRIMWNYNKLVHDEATISRLVNNYLAELQKIITELNGS